MARNPIPSWFYSLVVVRKADRFLLVHEVEGDAWYFPGGRVEPGESHEEGAIRETLEEGGIPVVLEGILNIERTCHVGGTVRQRVFFVARPADETPPKSIPDLESLEARWFTLAEVEKLRLRSEEVARVLSAVAAGAPVYPLAVMP